MAGVSIEDGNSNVQVVELGLIAAKQQAIFGNSDRDLILRTAGNIKIQAAGKFYDLPFNTDSNGNVIGNSVLTVVANITELGNLKYPGDGQFVYVTDTKGFYLTNNGNYTLVYKPPVNENIQYLSYTDSQALTGSQKLIVANNQGKFIGQIANVNSYSNNNVYENQLLYSLTEGKHFRLTNVNDPSNVASWKELYMPLGGSATSGGLHLDKEYGSNRLIAPTLTDPILSIGSPDFTKGLATWSNDSNVYFQSLANNSLRGFNFLTKDNFGTVSPTMTVLNNSVGIGGTDVNYNFNVAGTSAFKGQSTFSVGLNSPDFLKGTDGSGFAISKDSSGEWTLEIDDFIVRNRHDDYQTQGLNGAQFISFDIRVLEADFIEEIPMYIKAVSSGRYSTNTGVVRELSTRNAYLNVKSIAIADLDNQIDTVTRSLNFINPSYAIGDRNSSGVVDNTVTFNKSDDGTYYTPLGNISYNGTDFVDDSSGDLVLINTIGVYFIRSTSQEDIRQGDMLYYKQWDSDKFYKSAIHAEVVNVTADGYYIYAYDNPTIDNTVSFVKIGNRDGTGAIIQTNAADLATPSTELLSGITSFRSFYQNFYYEQSGDFVETDDLPEDSWIDKANTRVKFGDLSNIVDSDLFLSTTQYGLYSDNVFLKGNFVVNQGKYLNIPTITTYTDNIILIGADGRFKQASAAGLVPPPAQIQSDWTQTNTAAVDYIKNKPAVIPQLQSDWNQTNTVALDYIKNKPTNLVINTRAVNTVGSGITGGGNLTVDRNISLDFSYLDGKYQPKEDQRLSIGNSVRFAGVEISTTGIDQSGLIWYANQDYAKIYFQSTGDDNYDSNQVFLMGDNGLLSGTQEGWLFIKDVSTDIGGRIEVLRMNLTQFKYRNQDIPYCLARGNYNMGDVPLGGSSYTISLGTTLASNNYMVMISVVSVGATAGNDLVYAPLVRTKTTTSFTVYLSEQANVTQNISLDWYCIPM